MSQFKRYAKYYDLIYADKDYKGEANMVYRWANKPKTILDLGCGTGQHIKYWIKKANVIVGIDNSKPMVKKACELVLTLEEPWQKGKEVIIRKDDITQLSKQYYSLYDPFDATFAMFNVVGYLDYYQFEKLLENLPLKKGGYFIFDCWDYDKIYLHSKPRIVTRDKITRVSFLHHSATVFFYIYDKNHKLLCNEAHEITSYSAHLIKAIAKAKGYKVAGFKDTNGWARWWRLKKL